MQPVRLQTANGRDYSAGVETLFVKGASTGRMISGLASSNRQFAGTILISAGCTVPTLPIPLRWEHREEIGEVTFLRRSDHGIYIRARLYQSADDAWTAVYYGRADGLSSSAVDGDVIEHDGVRVFHTWRLREVSICEQPRNPDCRLRIHSGGRYA
jgi:hypothetical protein